MADFAAIAPRYPVFRVGAAETPARNPHGTSPRRRHWWRPILACTGALVVLIIVGIGAFIKLQPTLAPLALPAAAANAPADLARRDVARGGRVGRGLPGPGKASCGSATTWWAGPPP